MHFYKVFRGSRNNGKTRGFRSVSGARGGGQALYLAQCFQNLLPLGSQDASREALKSIPKWTPGIKFIFLIRTRILGRVKAHYFDTVSQFRGSHLVRKHNVLHHWRVEEIHSKSTVFAMRAPNTNRPMYVPLFTCACMYCPSPHCSSQLVYNTASI